MLKLATVAACLMTSGFAIAPAVAQQRPAADCPDDRGVDRCSSEKQRRMRELYGVRSIEEHRDAGDQMRRVFYVDGYGRDLILISFVRSPGRDPAVQVRYPRRLEGEAAAPLEAAVPQAVWDEVIARTENFDRSFVAQTGAAPDICSHAWVYVAEATGRPRPTLPTTITRKTESACEDGPTAAFAREVQRLAIGQFPHCAALDPEQHRNPASMLDTCRILSGDRLAAAEALNHAGAFRRVSTRSEAGAIHGRFDHRAVVDWNGARNSAEGSAFDFWLDRVFAEGRPSLFVESVEGESADRVRLTGLLSRSTENTAGDTAYHQARVEQLWVRDVNGELAMERATVGPWQVRPGG